MAKDTSKGKDTSTGGDATDEEVTERIRQLNERIIEAARTGGNAYLDAYEKTLLSILDYQERMGEASQVDWLQRIIETQASFTREMVRLSTASAREMLK